MTVDSAMPKLMSLPVRAASVSRGSRTMAMTAQTRDSPGAPAVEAPTPFYDQLMAMIDATKLESRRTPAGGSMADLGDSAASHRRRIRQAFACIAGLTVAAVIGGVMFALDMGRRQPPVLAANNAVEERSHALANANTTDGPVEKPFVTARRSDLGAIGVEGVDTAEGDAGTMGPMAEHSKDRTVVAPVAEQPIKKLGSGVEPQAEGAANAQTSAEPRRSDPAAPATDPGSKQQVSGDEPLSPAPAGEAGSAMDRADEPVAMSKQQVPGDEPLSPAPAGEAGSSIDRADEPVAIGLGRTISGVNMRAGPSNGQAVLAAIPGGTLVQVINCRQWCEVIFAGQQGWVYKSFIEISRAPRRP